MASLLTCGVLPALAGCGLVGGEDTYTVTAYFDRAVSVFPSSDVRVLGLPAGSVSDVEIDGDQVRVDMAIPSSIEIPADATAQIIPQSLIGERYIQISPAFTEGMTPAEDGTVIEKTVIPVEPDEALAAIKEFLDSLDPDGIGRLVTNLDEDLRDNGQALNGALGSLSQLVETFAEKDDALLRIVDSFDTLSATLATREQQLGEVLDAFSAASQVLADERQSIEELVAGLADLSTNGLALIGEHSGALRTDIETLAEAASSIETNLTAVTELLAAGPQLSAGIIGAYNPELRALDLRNNFSPLVTDVLGIFDFLGLPTVCLPVLQACPSVSGQAGTAATPAQIAEPARADSPVSALLDLLETPAEAANDGGPGLLDRWGAALDDAADNLLGVTG